MAKPMLRASSAAVLTGQCRFPFRPSKIQPSLALKLRRWPPVSFASSCRLRYCFASSSQFVDTDSEDNENVVADLEEEDSEAPQLEEMLNEATEEEAELKPIEIPVAEETGQQIQENQPEEETTQQPVEESPQEEETKEELPSYALNFLWLDRHIAVGVDHIFARGQSSPLTEYFFWPRNDAWEELKSCLEGKPWISERDKILLLNRTTEVINFWQDEENKHTIDEARDRFPECTFSGA